jgi:phosphoglycolate phosphatase
MKPTTLSKIKKWLSTLSFHTGLIVLIICAICYIISFAQMLLPISVTAKGTLWFIFFGLAKTAQYSALLILGKAGIEKIRERFKKPV